MKTAILIMPPYLDFLRQIRERRNANMDKIFIVHSGEEQKGMSSMAMKIDRVVHNNKDCLRALKELPPKSTIFFDERQKKPKKYR